ncbi:MAG: lysozyme inhibitor LprI family protein [Shimia sp.]
MRCRGAILAAGLSALGGGAAAQELDCTAPQVQIEMTACAERAWQDADRMLNAVYRDAIAAARSIDQGAAEMGMARPDGSTEERLREAQRSWIAFRDRACGVEGDLAFGGSMRPMLVYACWERLTLRRTEDLRFFGTPM